jgi:hypothetical protein
VDVTLLQRKRREGFFLGVKMIRGLFVLLRCLKGMKVRFVKLLSLTMRLRKRGWQGKLLVKSVFGGPKSAGQGERDGFFQLGRCYRYGSGCVKDAEKGKKVFLVAAELGHVVGMVSLGKLLEKDDSQRFYWFGRAATANGDSFGSVYFMNEIRGQIRKFSSGTGHASVIFAIGRALKVHIDNEKGTIFGNVSIFDSLIDLSMKLSISTNFNCNRIEKQSAAG